MQPLLHHHHHLPAPLTRRPSRAGPSAKPKIDIHAPDYGYEIIYKIHPPPNPADPADAATLPPDQLPLIPNPATDIHMRKYATAVDNRNFLTVYEYSLNNQWIIWDYFTGYVHLTGLWKALGHSKADIVKLLETSPDLEPVIKRVRGGFLKIQGTWVPFDIAKTLAARTCFHIRYALVPLFGPDFPASCLKPHEPGFGQLQMRLVDPAARKRRRASKKTPPKAEGSSGKPGKSPNGPLTPFSSCTNLVGTSRHPHSLPSPPHVSASKPPAVAPVFARSATASPYSASTDAYSGNNSPHQGINNYDNSNSNNNIVVPGRHKSDVFALLNAGASPVPSSSSSSAVTRKRKISFADEDEIQRPRQTLLPRPESLDQYRYYYKQSSSALMSSSSSSSSSSSASTSAASSDDEGDDVRHADPNPRHRHETPRRAAAPLPGLNLPAARSRAHSHPFLPPTPSLLAYAYSPNSLPPLLPPIARTAHPTTSSSSPLPSLATCLHATAEPVEPVTPPPPLPPRLSMDTSTQQMLAKSPSELVQVLQATRSLQQMSAGVAARRWSFDNNSRMLGGSFECAGKMWAWDGSDGLLVKKGETGDSSAAPVAPESGQSLANTQPTPQPSMQKRSSVYGLLS